RLEQISSTIIAYANAFSAILLIIFSLLLCVLMDRTGKIVKYIIIFTVLTVILSIGLGIFGGINSLTIFGIANGLFITILFFVFSTFTYGSGNIFYDGMLSSLGNKKEVPLLSEFGVALGSLGTLFGIFSVLLIVGDAPIHNAFCLSGLFFLLFSFPLFILNNI